MAKYTSLAVRKTRSSVNTTDSSKISGKTAKEKTNMHKIELTKNVENPVTGKKVERKAIVALPEFTGDNGTNDASEALNNALAACNGDSLVLVKWFEHGIRAQAKQVAANSLLTFGDAETKKALRDFADAVKVTMEVMEIDEVAARAKVSSKPKFADMTAKVNAFEAAIADNPTNTFDFTVLANLKQPRWFGGAEEDEADEGTETADGAK